MILPERILIKTLTYILAESLCCYSPKQIIESMRVRIITRRWSSRKPMESDPDTFFLFLNPLFILNKRHRRNACFRCQSSCRVHLDKLVTLNSFTLLYMLPTLLLNLGNTLPFCPFCTYCPPIPYTPLPPLPPSPNTPYILFFYPPLLTLAPYPISPPPCPPPPPTFTPPLTCTPILYPVPLSTPLYPVTNPPPLYPPPPPPAPRGDH